MCIPLGLQKPRYLLLRLSLSPRALVLLTERQYDCTAQTDSRCRGDGRHQGVASFIKRSQKTFAASLPVKSAVIFTAQLAGAGVVASRHHRHGERSAMFGCGGHLPRRSVGVGLLCGGVKGCAGSTLAKLPKSVTLSWELHVFLNAVIPNQCIVRDNFLI